MEKILSIAVPSYNVEQYIDKCLTSFSDSRFAEDLEIIIVNDGSTDNTVDIAQGYVERFPDIFKLVNKENGGHGSAVNAGIDHATGKYFRIVDGDDWVDTENMVKLLNILKKLDTDLVVDEKREVNIVTGKTQLFEIPNYVEKNKNLIFTDICTREDIGSFIMIHTLSVKTELLKNADIHLLEHVFYVDYEYIVKATCLGKTITFFDLEIYQYLVGNINQSVSSQNYVKRISHHEAVTKELLRFAVCSGYQNKRKEYLVRKVNLIIHTHYNIALIFNLNRQEGVRQAKEFRRFLEKTYPEFERNTSKRYYQGLMLHYLGFDSQKLNKLMGRK